VLVDTRTREEMRTENILCVRMRVKVHGFGGVAIYIYVRQSIPTISQAIFLSETVRADTTQCEPTLIRALIRLEHPNLK
jgi:hypothetical protein